MLRPYLHWEIRLKLFLQSLLDSHEEVLSFNGHLKLYTEFFVKSKCLSSKLFDLQDLAHEFIGLYIERFNSKYDFLERKDQLGTNENDSLRIDTKMFIKRFLSILIDQDHTKQNILLAIHAAFHESCGFKFEKLKIFLYHAHHFDEAYKFIEDFPETTIICTTRDPRAGFVSTIENWKKFDELDKSSNTFDHDNYIFFLFHLKRITEEEGRLVYSGMKHIIVKLENLLNRKYMEELSRMLMISFNDMMMIPTLGGKVWYGDRISGSKIKKFEWTAQRTYNGWHEKLSWRERFIFNFIMYSKLKRNQYDYSPITIYGFILVIIFALFPFKYEYRYFSINYIISVYKINKIRCIYFIILTPINLLKIRVLIFKYALIQIYNKFFSSSFKFLP